MKRMIIMRMKLKNINKVVEKLYFVELDVYIYLICIQDRKGLIQDIHVVI
jgi:hypothetical protein